jgi:hypothetical protein
MSDAAANPIARTYAPRARLRRFRALLRKEALQVVRDPSSILIAFVLPVVLLFLFGYALSLDANLTRVGVVMESPTPAARDLAASFQASRYFRVQIGVDRRDFADDLVANRIKGLIVIPAGFGEGDSASQIQILVDGSDPNTANFVMNYAQGVVATWRALTAVERGQAPAPMIDVAQRVWFNQELISRNFLIPGAIAIVMTMIGTLLTALVVAREWERGTMEAMMATPVTSAERRKGDPLLRARPDRADALRPHIDVRLRRPLPRLAAGALRPVGRLPLSGARPRPDHLGRDQEPVPRLAAGARHRLPAVVPAVGLLVRDRLDADIHPVDHRHRAGALLHPRPAVDLPRRRHLAAASARHRDPARRWRVPVRARRAGHEEEARLTCGPG